MSAEYLPPAGLPSAQSGFPEAAKQRPADQAAAAFAGPLLTETITTVDWQAVAERVRPSRETMHNMLSTATRYPEYVAYGASSLAGQLEGNVVRPAKSRGIIDGIVKSRINEKVVSTALAVDAIGNYQNPQAQLLAEARAVYDCVARAELSRGDSNRDREVDTLQRLASGVANLANPQFPRAYEEAWLEEHTPMLARILPSMIGPGMAANLRRGGRIKLAAPELLEGLRGFLEQHGQDVAPIEIGYAGFFREIGLLVSGKFRKRLAAIPRRVQDSLEAAYAITPKDGPRFKEQVAVLAKKVATATDVKSTVRGLFAKQSPAKQSYRPM